MPNPLKQFRQDLQERDATARSFYRTERDMNAILYPNRKPSMWDDVRIELQVFCQRLFICLLVAVFAAIIYPIAIYIFLRLLF